MSTIESLIRVAYTGARSIIAKGEEAAPIWFACTASGDIFVYITPWQDDREKQMIASALRLIFAARNVVRYVMASEAWIVHRSKEEMDDEGGDLPVPSECPDRQEVLSIFGVEEGRSIGAQAPILHTGDERSLGPLKIFDDVQSSGRFVDLLPDPTWPPAPPGTAEMVEAKLATIGVGVIDPRIETVTKH